MGLNITFISDTHDKYAKLCEKHGIIYLNDAETVIGGVKIWGSPVPLVFLIGFLIEKSPNKSIFNEV